MSEDTGPSPKTAHHGEFAIPLAQGPRSPTSLCPVELGLGPLPTLHRVLCACPARATDVLVQLNSSRGTRSLRGMWSLQGDAVTGDAVL